MINVSWRQIILTGGTFSGRRVKRQVMLGNPLPVHALGTYPSLATDDPNVWSAKAPKTLIGSDGNKYLFAFWSLKPLGFVPSVFTPIQPSPSFDIVTPTTDLATIDATAWYVWDFGSGGGEHGIWIDAFDIDACDFIADDFVKVAPDPTNTLYASANDGWISTTTQIAEGSSLTVTAQDVVGKKFKDWFEISALTSGTPPTISGPDIVAHHDDIMVAIAFYRQVERPIRIPHFEVFDPWWWVKTHGGLTPPGPPDPLGPWLRQFAGALALADTANRVAPTLRSQVLRVALQQLSMTQSALKAEIKNDGR